MEIHQLQYVVEVARHRHFTRAAEAVCVAQSSLSQQITKLEAELGIKLFERTTRSVYPTVAGEEFILYARRILTEIDNASQAMQGHARLTRGTVNLGAITTLESIDFVSMITAFHHTYPALHINIANTGSYHLTEKLRTLEINAAIFSPQVEIDLEDLELYELADDEFVLVTAASHPLARRGTVDLCELAAEDFIFPSPDQSIFNIYHQACREAGFKPTIVCQSGHSESSLALVANGMGIGFFPRDTVMACPPPGIAILHLSKPIAKKIALALLRSPHYPPPVVAFRDFVLNWVGNRQRDRSATVGS